MKAKKTTIGKEITEKDYLRSGYSNLTKKPDLKRDASDPTTHKPKQIKEESLNFSQEPMEQDEKQSTVISKEKSEKVPLTNAKEDENDVAIAEGGSTKQAGGENSIGGSLDFFDYEPQPMCIQEGNKYLTTYPYFLTPSDILQRNTGKLNFRQKNFGNISIDKIRRSHPEKGSGYTITKKINGHGYGKVDTTNIWNYITPSQFTKEVNKGAYAYRVKSTGIRFVNINPHNASTKSTSSNNDSTFKKPYLQFISSDKFNAPEPEWSQRKYQKMVRTPTPDSANPPVITNVISWVENPITETIQDNRLMAVNLYETGIDIVNQNHKTNCKNSEGICSGADLYYDTKINCDVVEDYGTNINTAPWRHSYLTMVNDTDSDGVNFETDLSQPINTEYPLFDELYSNKSSKGCKIPITQVGGTFTPADPLTQTLKVMNKTTVLEDQTQKSANYVDYEKEMPFFDIRDDNPFNTIIPDTLDDDCTYTHTWQNPSDNFLIFEDPNLAIFSKEVQETKSGQNNPPDFTDLSAEHYIRADNWDPSRFFEKLCVDNSTPDPLVQTTGRFNLGSRIQLPIVENDQWQHYNPGDDKVQVKSDMGRSNEGYFSNAKNQSQDTLLVRNMPLPSSQSGETWFDNFDPFEYGQVSYYHAMCEIQYFAEIEFRYRDTPKGVKRSVLKDSMYGFIPEIVYSFKDFKTELNYKLIEHLPKPDEVYPYSLILNQCQDNTGKHKLELNNVPYTSSQIKRQEVKYLESKYARINGGVQGTTLTVSNIDSTSQVVFGTENQMFEYTS